MNGGTKPLPRHEATNLPFMSEESYWAVTTSGDSDQDYETGKKYALMAIDYSVQDAQSTELVICVLSAISTKREFGWLEQGFIIAIVRAAFFYRRSLLQGELERARTLWPPE